MRRMVFLILASCTPHLNDMPVASLPVKRQKQKLMVLEKKLESAEKQQVKIAKEVEHLQDEIQEVELAIVRKMIADCESGKQRSLPANLFLAERETLHRLIQTGPSRTSFEAQVVLDQILRMITNMSETQ